jgi:transposase
LNQATLPAAVVQEPVCGPRLTALVVYFSGVMHASKRQIEAAVEAMFGVPLALGTISKLEQEVSAALASAHAEAQRAIQAADAKNVDETGWKLAGDRCWLWAAATLRVACFVIHPWRGATGLAALLGEGLRGVLSSDRWGAYNRLPVRRRQLCWAHLKRDFQKLVERGGVAQEVGDMALGVLEIVFKEWHRFRGGGQTRPALQREVAWLRDVLRDHLERGRTSADTKTATFCANVLKLEPALWTFTRREGVEPTNNHIERVLRPAVLWRKNAFGCHSEAGCRFVERILTVVQTRRLQQRPILEYLHQAILAHRQNLATPQLLGVG